LAGLAAWGWCSAAGAEVDVAREEIRVAWKESGPATAAEVASRWMLKHPEDPGLRAQCAEALLGAGNLDGAEKALADWTKSKAPREGPFYEWAGVLARERGKSGEALNLWMAGAPRPDGIGCLIRAESGLRQQRRWAELEAILTQALARAPDNPRLRVWRARARMQLRGWEGASDDFTAATARAPDDSEIKNLFPPWERFEAEQADRARLDAQVEAVTAGDPMPWVERAAFYLRHELRTPALEDLEAARKMFDASPTLRLLVAQEIRAQGAPRERWLEMQPLISVSGPTLWNATVVIARHVEADRAVIAEPAVVAPLIARASLWRGSGQPGLALADADAALAIEPRHALALGERAHALGVLGRSGESMLAWFAAEEAGLDRGELLMAAARHAESRGDWVAVARLAASAGRARWGPEAMDLETRAELILGKRRLTK